MTPGSAQFQYTYQINPISLQGGIAENMPQGLSILNLLQSANFPSGVLSSSKPLNLDDYFANFVPVSGGTLSENEVGLYPFANAQVAANAVIAQPLRISLRMICPARGAGGYSSRRAVFQNLKDQLDIHNSSGGTYTVATPAFTYTNCLLLKLEDQSPGQTKQMQMEWRWDFFQPLLTEQQAQVSLNNMMNKITKATRWVNQPAWSGIDPTVGLNSSLAAIGLVPSMQGGTSPSTAAPSSPPNFRP